MGFHYSSRRKPIWGDTPAEIIQEAFQNVKKAFQDEQGREMTKADLILGCWFGIEDLFGNDPFWHNRIIKNIADNPPGAEIEPSHNR